MKVTVDDATLTSIHSLSVGASKDDIAVITQIALKREGDALRAMTTDRYICLTGLYSNAEFEDWADGEEMLIDPKHLKSVVDIMKLFPEGEPNGSGSLNIRPDFIAKLAKVLPPVGRPERDRIWSFEFRSIEEQPNKPQPVYARYHGEGYTMEALIQPALIQR